MQYKSSSYYQSTKHPYLAVLFNKGRYGEYLTYKRLRKAEKDGAKFLFNLYIPKENGETTEIDVLMLCSKGIFVFESKNYSGWIFGSENQKNWYQTLPLGRGKSRKESFYNPIMQNRMHIKHLTTFLGEDHCMPMHSVVIFSERCTLKKIQIQSEDVYVVKRCDVGSVVSSICNGSSEVKLSIDIIDTLYDKLFPYTQVDSATKARHISNIHGKLDHPEPNTYSSAVQATDLNIEPPNTDTAPQSMLCPRCNGKLVLRTASRGNNVGKQFYGCSNYPKCKYIKNIENTPTD